MPGNLLSIFDLATFRQDRREWLVFGKYILLAGALPVLLVFLLCEFLCWKSGELIPDSVAAARQASDPSVIWAAHNDGDTIRFKLLRAAEENPDVLVIGQSRVGAFRSGMFAPYRFYNLTRSGWTMASFFQILQHLPASVHPKVIIFSLDYFMFDSQYDTMHQTAVPRFAIPGWESHFFSLRQAFVDLMKDPTLLFQSQPATRIGLTALFPHKGFRADGSFVWPDGWEKLADDQSPVIARLKNHPGETNAVMSDQDKTALEQFAALARQRHIQLVGVQMPIFRPVAQILDNPAQCHLLQDFRLHLANGYFDRLGIITFDFLDFPPYDTEILNFANDATHPAEVMTAAVVLRLHQDPRVHALLPNLDTATLQRRVQQQLQSRQFLYLN